MKQLITKNKEVIVNREKEYYKNNKEIELKYRKLCEKEKDIKREYGRNRYKNISEEIKLRLKEYQKIIVKPKSQGNFQ